MKKLRIALFVTLVALLVITGSALAQDDDPRPAAVNLVETGAGVLNGASEYSPPEGQAGVLGGSLIRNGAFDDWTGNTPVAWQLWNEASPGWEAATAWEVDLAVSPEGINNALGWFIRNVGGAGSYYAGAYQQLDLIPAAGNYFVSISEAVYEGADSPAYNSVAWYAISPFQDPGMVPAEDWRELDPYVSQCPNFDGWCTYAGRDETVWIEPGDYFHVMVAEKYPQFNNWSFFVIDDIMIVPANPTAPEANYPNGFYEWLNWSTLDAIDEKCHYMDETCNPYITTDVFVPTWVAD